MVIKKRLSYNQDARESLIRGVNTLAKTVTITLGPRGRNVGLARKWNAPRIVHDGVSVAKEVDVDDPFEQMGIELAREAATKTNDIAGDGTTTSILLTQELLLAGDKAIKDGANPMAIQRGMNVGVEQVVKKLTKMSKPVKDSETIAQVATLSAADSTIGKLITEAIDKVGKKGVVSAEEGKGSQNEIEYKVGMEFDRGWVDSFFATNKERMYSEIENPYIFLTSEKISANSQLLPILNAIGNIEKGNKFGIVIIADKVDYEAFQTLAINHERGVITALAMEAPGFGEDREELLQDIASLVGGKVFSTRSGMSFTEESLTPDVFGHAQKVWANKESTRIIGAMGDKEVLALRIKQIETKLKKETSDYKKENLEERIAKLAGSVAVIKVGAATEAELHDRKERIVDAIAATKSAIAEGVLPGGGVALLRAREVLMNEMDQWKLDLNDEEKVGIDILYKALRRPIERLFEIAGENPKEVKSLKFWKKTASTDKIKVIEESSSDDYGFNVVTREYGSMLDMGVIDPTRVVRAGLQNAVSVSGIILTTEALVAVIEEGKKNEYTG